MHTVRMLLLALAMEMLAIPESASAKQLFAVVNDLPTGWVITQVETRPSGTVGWSDNLLYAPLETSSEALVAVFLRKESDFPRLQDSRQRQAILAGTAYRYLLWTIALPDRVYD